MVDVNRIAAAVWPWGTETPQQLETALSEVSKIGYKSFESVKSSIYAFDLDVKAYKRVVEKFGVYPVSFYFHLPQMSEYEAYYNNLDKEFEFVSELGVKRACLQGTGSRPEKMGKAELQQELDVCCRFAEKAKEHGIKANLHTHHNTWVMYEKEIDNILQNTDNDLVSFAPDTAHLVAGKCDVMKVLEKYKYRINFTHLKDISNSNVESEGLAAAGMEVYGNFCELGKGSVDYSKVFGLLKDVGYKGYLCEELDVAPISNKESAKNNFNFILNNYKW